MPPASAGELAGDARVLLYALDGGLGHATRGLALARQLLRAGARGELLVASRLAAAIPLEAELGPRGLVRRLDPEQGPAALRAAVAAAFAAATPAAVVVDTFPRGLLGELPALLARSPAARVWVQRLLAPEYLAWAGLPGSAPRFDLVLRPGEAVPGARGRRTLSTAPWLVRDARELLRPEAARAALGVGSDLPLVVVAGAGTAEEVRAQGRLAERLAERLIGRAEVRLLAPPGPPAPGLVARWVWPLLSHLPGVDLLVGAGGYHTVHEARATGTPLLALARPRLYDRQALRLRPEELARDEDDLLARASARCPAVRRAGRPDYAQGAADASAALLALLTRVPLCQEV